MASSPGSPETPPIETCHALLEAGLQILQGKETIDTCRDFHESVDNLIRVCHVDPFFTYITNGPGFDGTPVITAFKGEHDSLRVIQNEPSQSILFVHTPSMAITDWSIQYKQKKPLLFYVSRSCRPGCVRLQLSSNTYAHLLKGPHGVVFTKDSVELLPDDFETVKFYLSAREFENSLVNLDYNILNHFQPNLAKLKINFDDLSGLRGQIFRANGASSRLNIYAFKCIPAISCAEWPDIAYGWSSRARPAKWPPRSLIMEIVEGGCHFVPASYISGDVDSNCQWMAAFVEAEKLLVQSWSEPQHNVAYLVLSIFTDKLSLSDRLVKMLLFWVFEECTLTATMEDILNGVRCALQKLSSFLENGNFPDYFVEENNHLLCLDESSLESSLAAVIELQRSLMTTIMSCEYLPFSAVQAIVDNIDPHRLEDLSGANGRIESLLSACLQSLPAQLQSALWESFQESCRLSLVLIHTNVCRHSLEEAIIMLQELLRLFHNPATEHHHSAAAILYYLNCLGSLYHVKSMDCKGVREKQHLVDEAQKILTSTKNMDVCFGRIRLANFLYQQQKYHEAINELKDVYDNLERRAPSYGTIREAVMDGRQEAEQTAAGEASKSPEKLETGKSPKKSASHSQSRSPSRSPSRSCKVASAADSVFKTCLWHQWDHCTMAHDVVYGMLQRPTCPAVMVDCVGLTLCPMLGQRKHTAALFSASFHAGLLYSLCLIGLHDLSAAHMLLQVRWLPRADAGLAPSQWETSLQSNDVSHWLCTNLESALGSIVVNNFHFQYEKYKVHIYNNIL